MVPNPFAPVRLGPSELRSRVIEAATFEGITPNAVVTDSLIDFHRRMAAGGVAMGRALLRDPDLARRLAEGEVTEGRCIHCNECMVSILSCTRCVLDHPEPLTIARFVRVGRASPTVRSNPPRVGRSRSSVAGSNVNAHDPAMAETIRNEEVMAGANRFARLLDAEGVATRGVVAALLRNTPEMLFAYRGTTWSGRRFTPMSWRWTPEECDYVVGNCGADCLVADARFADAARAAAHHVSPARRFSVGGEIEGFRSWSETARYPSGPLAEPLCGDVMMYTSGTTGRPKGVQRESFPEGPPPTLIAKAGMAMFQAFLPGSASQAGSEGPHPGAHLVCAPLYHSGPNTYCDGALLLGADVVLLDRFDAEEVLATIEAHRVMSTFMVPTHFVRLLRLPEATRARYDLSSLRLVMHGAAPVAPEVKRKMIDWLGPILFEFYGGTEGGGCMIGSEEWLERPGSVGRPRPGLSLHILDDEGREVPPHTEGGVYFPLSESPFVYKDDPDKTLGSRRGGLFTMGDIGYVDEDGYLFLCDRSADVIISGAVNVYPAQIEAALLELPFIADACVIGIPNEEWGEEVRALVELVAGRDAPSESDAHVEIEAHCRRRLAGYALPRGIEFRTALPRTETGKLARRLLRAPYWEGRERRV